MKKLFQHRKARRTDEIPYEDWDEEGGEYYADGGNPDGGAYCAADEDLEDGEYYAADEDPDSGAYYAASEDSAGGEYYAADEDLEDREYYAADEDPDGGAYCAADEDFEDGEYYAADEDLEDREYYAADEDPDGGAYYAAGEDSAGGAYYASGEDSAGGEYYAADEDLEDREYYAADEDPDGGAYYAADEDPDGREYYAADEDPEGREYYAAGEGSDGEAYYADGEYTGGRGYYGAGEDSREAGYQVRAEAFETGGLAAEEGELTESSYAAEYTRDKTSRGTMRSAGQRRPVKKSAKGRKASSGGIGNLFSVLWNRFLDMGAMDRIIVSTGVAVLVLAIVTGSVYFSFRMIQRQVSDFAGVGRELEGIGLIGEQGLLAVADAELAKIAAANAVIDEHVNQTQKEYEEEEYTKEVTVALSMVSIQKDLKIKFINKKTGKLVANVPFSVSITDPDGKTESWIDDDMDGIIYKKGITPGKYTVAMDSLSGDKYKDITIPTGTEKVNVKKDIEYKKVDVSNEIKKESEVNVSKEDTKLKDTKVESKLEDTVGWVESTSAQANYKEVAKSAIPDPAALAFAGRFQRLAYIGGISPTSRTIKVGESFIVTASSEGVTLQNVTWSSSDINVATVDTNGKVLGVGKGSAVITYQASGIAVSGNEAVSGLSGSCSVTVNEALGTGSLSVDNGAPVVTVGGRVSVKAVPAGFTAGKELVYSVVSNNTEIATATVDANGGVTVTGVKAGDAVLTVTVNYKEGGSAATAAAANITVKVAGNKVLTLDKTSATVYLGTPLTINASIANATTNSAVTAESSDTGVATVAVSGRSVVITGVKTGSANITVRYTENGEEVKAACAVVVKANPREDRSTKLKDGGGNQIYVQENNSYREAVYADYYNFDKFYIRDGSKYTGWQTLDGKVYFFDANGNKVTGEQVIQGAKYNFASDGSLVKGSATQGIDVSKWNGSIDWKAVKNSGIDFVIIRCGYRGSSQGSLIQDPKYSANIKGATAAGLKVGVYFFTQAVDEAEAIGEASMVLDLVKGYQISYPIFLDVEGSGGRGDRIDSKTRTAVVKAFCKTIQDAGYTAGVYANKSWLTNKMDAGQLSAYKIWLAQYASSPTYSGRYDLWQYRSTGRVSGISGNVDMNWSYMGY